KTLDENPEVWRQVGDLAAHARLTLIRLIAKGDMLLFESIQRQAGEMECQLLGASPSLLERLSVQRVVACWLQLQYADVMACTENDQLAQTTFWSQHQDRAHRRYTSAVKQLAMIRQLLPGTSGVEDSKPASAASDQSQNVVDEDCLAESRPEVTGNGSQSTFAVGGNGQAEVGPHGLLNGHANGHSKSERVAISNDAATSPPRSESGEAETKPKNGKPINRILPLHESAALSSVAN
ncbi:MAG: hypothetical protein IH991_22470, partial [Planctomycetes bacterium]|nr:hypothetical protein [Planctomycetota bacterium]